MRRSVAALWATMFVAASALPGIAAADDAPVPSPVITDVSPETIDGCGAEPITVTGTGFTNGGAPNWAFAVIAESASDFNVLRLLELNDTEMVFDVDIFLRPLTVGENRTLVLADQDANVLTQSEVLEFAPCTVIPPDVPGAPTVTPGVGVLEVSWNEIDDFGSEPADGYAVVWRAVGDGPFEAIPTAPDVTDATITGLSAEVDYEVWIFATNEILRSGFGPATGPVRPLAGNNDDDDNDPDVPVITGVGPDPIDGCGLSPIIVTGTGFLDEGAPAWAFAVIAASDQDFSFLRLLESSDTELVFDTDILLRPLAVDGDRSLVLADQSATPLAQSDPLTIEPCTVVAPDQPGAPTVTPGVGTLEVSWDPIASFGSEPKSSYAVIWEWEVDGGMASGSILETETTQTTIPDLQLGVEYQVRIVALNEILPSISGPRAGPFSTLPEPGDGDGNGGGDGGGDGGDDGGDGGDGDGDGGDGGDGGADEPAPTVGFRAVTPARLLDTRVGGDTVDGAFAGGGRAAAASVTRVTVAGRGGTDAEATTAVVAVAAVEPAEAGYLTVFGCSDNVPLASNLNFAGGGATANSVVVALGSGDVCVYTSTETDLVLDVNGSFALDSLIEPIDAVRLADTRSPDATVDGASSGGGPLAADTELQVRVAGRGGISGDAVTALLNITVVEPAAAGFVSVYPCATGRPDASNVNFGAGQTVANFVVSTLDTNGDVCVYTSADAHVLIDASGSSPMIDDLVALVPARLFDSRVPGATIDGDQRGGGRLAADQTAVVDVAGRGAVPDQVSAVVVNATVVEAADPGFLTIWDCGTPMPVSSNLNFGSGPGTAFGAGAFVEVSTAGQLCVYSSAATDLLVDVTVALR